MVLPSFLTSRNCTFKKWRRRSTNGKKVRLILAIYALPSAEAGTGIRQNALNIE
jgi:hypothetical protein